MLSTYKSFRVVYMATANHFFPRLGIPRIFLPAAPGDPGALSAPMLNIGGGVAVASLAPNPGEGAEKPPNVGTAGVATGVLPKANDVVEGAAEGAPKLNEVAAAVG